MSGDQRWFEEPDDELRDDEFPDPDQDPDLYDDDFSETLPCPQCGNEVYEDAVRCPHCGTYITHGTNVWSQRPAWWIVLGLLGVLAVILVLAGVFGR